MIITRYHNMTTMQLTVEFLTPTFLGGADQHAELRAAPFKNLLRQWWRVALGSQYDKHGDMLMAEGELFGSVLDENQASASKVRLTLTPVEGSFFLSEQEFKFGTTTHPEVKGGFAVANALYLGFGPITLKKGQVEFKRYIVPGSKANLRLSFPEDQHDNLFMLLQYIDSFGAVGSRARNGWGSLALAGEDFERKEVKLFKATDISLLVDKDKGKPYPSLLGSDSGGALCWETGAQQDDWKVAMKSLAETYMKLRTKINVKPQGLRERHLLGYPVTNHFLTEWGGKNGRMPSQLRLMVKRNPANQLVGRILHLPHCLPKDKPWNNKLGLQRDIWQTVHTLLDANKQFHRCGGAQ